MESNHRNSTVQGTLKKQKKNCTLQNHSDNITYSSIFMNIVGNFMIEVINVF